MTDTDIEVAICFKAKELKRIIESLKFARRELPASASKPMGNADAVAIMRRKRKYNHACIDIDNVIAVFEEIHDNETN